jgi:ribose 1,5-bisphosphokinase
MVRAGKAGRVASWLALDLATGAAMPGADGRTSRPESRGRRMLVLVVGPSGAGKDTLLTAARAAFAGDLRFRFIQRVITRPADGGAEAHEAVSEAEFVTRSFALFWQAHGLRYGIPATIETDLAAGLVVVANVSRAVIADAARRYPVRVIEVTAPPDVLAARLAARGRDTAAAITARLTRTVPVPGDIAVDRVVNDSTPEIGAERFLAALTRAAAAAR